MMMRLILPAALLLAPMAGAAATGASTTSVPMGLRLLFVAVDRNADGKIDQAEADQFVDRLFGQADADADGVLSLAEVTALQGKIAPGTDNARSVQANFKRMDRNRDGVVDGREANKAALGHFAFLDSDNDGVITLADLAGRDLVAPVPGSSAR